MYLEVFIEIFLFTYDAAYHYAVYDVICLPRLCIMILWLNHSENVNNPFRCGKMRCTLKCYFPLLLCFIYILNCALFFLNCIKSKHVIWFNLNCYIHLIHKNNLNNRQPFNNIEDLYSRFMIDKFHFYKHSFGM